MKRKIPATMATQHPDHASTPYWHNQPFISNKEEPYEAYLNFKDLDIDEYKWDWEGKLVDEAVVERILQEYYDYFKEVHLGKDKFLTFRLPNPKVETEYRLGRAFMGIIAASGLVNHLGLSKNPLFEVILPMTSSAKEMIEIQEAFKEISSIRHPLLKRKEEDINHIELIPLFEDIETISRSDEILDEYLQRHQAQFGFKPEYIRPYVARSDPALNAGLIPTVLAIKLALSKYKQFSRKHQIDLYPMIGAAALPFRGGINPDRVDEFINEYKGIKTTTIQSAFRYDFEKDKVIEALQKLKNKLPESEAMSISLEEEINLREIMSIFSNFYRTTIEEIAPVINQISQSIPKRRERVQHIGLFGYSRGVGKVKLPRAISFTASLYSLGVPPEIIGTGRGLRVIKDRKLLALLYKIYINMRSDLLYALKYTNKEVIEELAKVSPAWSEIKTDIKEIEKFLNNEPYEISDEQKEHQKFSQDILRKLKDNKTITSEIEISAKLRKSLG